MEVVINKSGFFGLPKPRLFGHRGNPSRVVENTLPSFESALACGVRYLEMDLWMTRDGVPVIHHDQYLSRIFGSDAKISDLSLEALKQLTPKESMLPASESLSIFNLHDFSVPTFDEVLTNFPQAMFNLDFKLDSFDLVESSLDSILAHNLQEKVLVASEHDHLVDGNSRVIDENIPFALGFQKTREFFDWIYGNMEEGFDSRGSALQIPEFYYGHRLVSADNLKIAHDMGFEVHVWTVNDREKVRELLEMGVDGIMSDDPEMLVQEANSV